MNNQTPVLSKDGYYYILQSSGCGDQCGCHYVRLWNTDEHGEKYYLSWESDWVSDPYLDDEEAERFVGSTLKGLAQFGLTLKSKDFDDYWEWECVKI